MTSWLIILIPVLCFRSRRECLFFADYVINTECRIHNHELYTIKILASHYIRFLFSLEVKDIVHELILHTDPEPEKHGATGMIGHFTQLVWHDTYKVGCGFMQTKAPTKLQKDRIKSVSSTLLWDLIKLSKTKS